MSVEKDFHLAPPKLYRTSRKIIEKLNDISDLTLVHPGDYDISSGRILAGHKSLGPTKIKQVLGPHVPEGDMFIIYGDETSKNVGLDFARNQYKFLRNLKQNGNFSAFYNEPETEERTLKDALVELSKDDSLCIAKSYFFQNDEQVNQMLSTYGSVFLKPIFGCRMAGVQKISSLDDLKNLNIPESELQGNYILQEPLVDPENTEKRIIILDGNHLVSRTHFDRNKPWETSYNQKTAVYNPTEKEIEVSKNIASRIGGYLVGVDFIGSKVNEVNGTGTAVKTHLPDETLLYDKTDEVVKSILEHTNSN